MKQIELTKFPYPFKAALTICSDIDGCSFEDFMQMQKFINSSADTVFGEGLSLPIGNSFWMFDKQGLPNSAFSYFDMESITETQYATYMDEFIQAGILDVMHGYGNFNHNFPFNRKFAEMAIEVLDKKNHKLKTWTNHGGAENLQSIGKYSKGMGDIPTNQNYHTDLLNKYGIKFFWDSELNVSNIIGQERNSHFLEAYWGNPLYKTFRIKNRQIIKGCLSIMDGLLFKFQKKHFFKWAQANYLNDLVTNEQLRDGLILNKFKRFGHGRYDWSDDLPLLLNNDILQRLIKKNGYLVLYIHLGDRRQKSKYIFDSDSVKSLKKLSEYYCDKLIWIDTTSNLLQYNWVKKNIKWLYREYEDIISIDIEPMSDISSEDLSGLTFNVPINKSVQIYYQGKILK